MNEVKAISAIQCKLAATNDELMEIEGYGAAFNNVDSYGDVIAEGAFTKTLADRNEDNMPLMFLNHDGYTRLPIGRWTEMSQDQFGLKVRGVLLPTNEGRDTYTALKHKALNGLSIGFIPTETSKREKPSDPKRTIKSVDLLEVSVVTIPANNKARITSVKSADAIMSLRDLEEALRERGYSKSEALSITSRFEAKADIEEKLAAVATLKHAQSLINSLRGF
jgi:HK97 family phage prohead protease